MLLHRGAQSAGKGTYWNMSNGQRINLDAAAALPGGTDARYIKMPAAMMLLAGPVLGLLYAGFLPFIGIVMTLGLVGKKLFGGLAQVAAKSTSFGWRPIEAYLDGKQRRKKGAAKTKETTKHGVS